MTNFDKWVNVIYSAALTVLETLILEHIQNYNGQHNICMDVCIYVNSLLKLQKEKKQNTIYKRRNT